MTDARLLPLDPESERLLAALFARSRLRVAEMAAARDRRCRTVTLVLRIQGGRLRADSSLEFVEYADGGQAALSETIRR